MKHFTLFNLHSDYESYIADDNVVLPNISYCKDNDDVHFTHSKPDYSTLYFTTEALEDGTITFNILEYLGQNCNMDYISYSVDGINWVETEIMWIGYTINVPVKAGDKILWKGYGSATGCEGEGGYDPNEDNYITTSNYSYFSSTANFNVYGNIMSLLCEDNFNDVNNKHYLDVIEDSGYVNTFKNLFYNCNKLINANNLILPNFEKTERSSGAQRFGMYNYMFYNCTSLLTAPTIPNITYTFGVNLYGMFINCSNLTYIKALCTPPSSGFTNWVKGVSSTGTFVKKTSATWETGNNGIPNGWTVENID